MRTSCSRSSARPRRFPSSPRTSFDGVLDMLSGLYPSDEFAELRPRITWDRVTNILTPRPGAKRIAITSGGTIPDRGLFGVFLAGGEKMQSARVGELDEEMVFESRVGETFLLGASTWRIEEITHDRVLVTPAPGEPGKMPFWKADAAERTVPFGEAIGALVREVGAMQPAAAMKRLTSKHDLDERAAKNFLQYLDDQQDATGAVPDDRTIVIERVLDDLGDWRVCVLTPFGGRIHAPWAMAVTAKVRNELQIDVETMWSDDGFIVRFPDTDAAPRAELVIPDADEIEQLVVRQLGASSMFAAKFREAAARALLLPRIRPDRRTPLWQQRKRAYDLLQVASRFGSFPIILETYREVLRDVFDVPALVATMKKIQQRNDPRRRRRHREAIAVRRLAALPLRRELHLRRRRAAGRAPRAGAGHRSGPASRAPRRAGVARAARRRCAVPARAASCSISTIATKRNRSMRFTISCSASAISRSSEIAARSLVDANEAIARAGENAPHHRNPDRAREAFHRHRGRQPLPRRPRRRRFRKASPIAISNRSPIRPAISCSVSRARTGPSRRPTSRGATASASRS